MLIALLAALVAFQSAGFTDPRDGRVYGWRTHGDTDWFDRNLSHAAEGSVCARRDPDGGCGPAGVLYSTEAARTACPAGWRLPTGDDFRSLAEALGGASRQVGAASAAGAALADWGSPGFAVAGQVRSIPGHAIFHQQVEPRGDGGVTFGWHRYPVEGGIAFEPTGRADPTALAGLAASVRCVRDAARPGAG